MTIMGIGFISLALLMFQAAGGQGALGVSGKQVTVVGGHVVVEATFTNNTDHRVIVPNFRQPANQYLLRILDGAGNESATGKRQMGAARFPQIVESGQAVMQMVTLDDLTSGLPSGVYKLKVIDPEHQDRFSNQVIEFRVTR